MASNQHWNIINWDFLFVHIITTFFAFRRHTLVRRATDTYCHLYRTKSFWIWNVSRLEARRNFTCFCSLMCQKHHLKRYLIRYFKSIFDAETRIWYHKFASCVCFMGERTFIIERSRIAIKISQMKIIEIDTSAAPVGKYRKSKRDQREIARRGKKWLKTEQKGKKDWKEICFDNFFVRSVASGKEREKIDKRRRKKNVLDSLIYVDHSLIGNQTPQPFCDSLCTIHWTPRPISLTFLLPSCRSVNFLFVWMKLKKYLIS